jgi:hypothetical protein
MSALTPYRAPGTTERVDAHWYAAPETSAR